MEDSCPVAHRALCWKLDFGAPRAERLITLDGVGHSQKDSAAQVQLFNGFTSVQQTYKITLWTSVLEYMCQFRVDGILVTCIRISFAVHSGQMRKR